MEEVTASNIASEFTRANHDDLPGFSARLSPDLAFYLWAVSGNSGMRDALGTYLRETKEQAIPPTEAYLIDICRNGATSTLGGYALNGATHPGFPLKYITQPLIDAFLDGIRDRLSQNSVVALDYIAQHKAIMANVTGLNENAPPDIIAAIRQEALLQTIALT